MIEGAILINLGLTTCLSPSGGVGRLVNVCTLA